MNRLLIGLSLLLPLSSMASINPCLKAAITAVEFEFSTTADLNPDFKQPKGSGTYQMIIQKEECSFEVSVKMKKNSANECEAIGTPVLDNESANCG